MITKANITTSASDDASILSPRIFVKANASFPDNFLAPAIISQATTNRNKNNKMTRIIDFLPFQ